MGRKGHDELGLEALDGGERSKGRLDPEAGWMKDVSIASVEMLCEPPDLLRVVNRIKR